MHTPISVNDKKEFVRWFLNHFQLKKRESVWILNYLINHETLLSHVHFVDEVKFCPRGLAISAQGVQDPPFRFYKDRIMTTDAEKSFHDIRLNQDEAIYLQMNFKKAQQCSRYALVLEENPFLPKDYYVDDNDRRMVHRLLDLSILEHQKKRYESEIDRALENGEKERFYELTSEWKHIVKKLEDY
ncbi:ReoY family proteolytic degradation factor [Thalassobacillus sp. CUG 92003]|uniref:ReoY family proteolytic degradation factor n=1 Tax=Thalassobacillus sp. CUG 92003 TaxID=2736641 RepID=UPI0015E6A40E|nr:ReoY family proteolytic degradation factor [Thalassobacillus sp. CUG 92003]